MKPRLRKFALTAHVSVSVGWIGAVAGFLVLSVAGLISTDADTVRGAYLSMNLIGWYMIVPASFAAFGTGLVMALGTPWGLIRQYWVFTKFLLVSFGASLLLLHQLVVVQQAAIRTSGAAVGILPSAGALGTQLVADAILAIV